MKIQVRRRYDIPPYFDIYTVSVGGTVIYHYGIEYFAIRKAKQLANQMSGECPNIFFEISDSADRLIRVVKKDIFYFVYRQQAGCKQRLIDIYLSKSRAIRRAKRLLNMDKNDLVFEIDWNNLNPK